METLQPSVAASRPSLDARAAADICARLWNREGTARELPSERDRVFLIEEEDGERAVLKVANALERPELLELEAAMLTAVGAAVPEYRFPAPIRTPGGEPTATVVVGERTHRARLHSFVPGRGLGRVTPFGPALQHELGRVVALVDTALSRIDSPGERAIVWDPRGAPDLIRGNLGAIEDSGRRRLLERVLDGFDRTVAPVADALPVGLIHNDAHGDNVRVDPGSAERAARIVGLVDFGDAVRTWSVAGLATACAYTGFDRRDPIGTFAGVARGYAIERTSTEAEADVLFELIRLRLALSVTIAAVRSAHDPANPYLSSSEPAAWRLLERLDAGSADLARYRLRGALGLEPCPSSVRVATALAREAPDAAPVLDPDPRTAKTLIIDVSVESGDDGGTFDPTDHAAYTRLIFDRMRDADAPIGIGRYDEVRWWYTTPEFATPGVDGDEWRTVHLGVDLFAEPDTPVRTPLAGRVVSVHDNAGRLDYGPTVIVEHRLEDADGEVELWTLYGHLSPRTLEETAPGAEVEAGEVIGWLGAPPRNGDWAPHLHFQVIVDRLDHEETFPGVAAPSQRDVWTAISPDPGPLLGLPPEAAARRPRPLEEMLGEREERLAPSLSLSYRKPLHIVRGRGARLFDVDGQPYLDCVNNVAHVGHAHPRITEVLRRQSGILNTNTRYLHETILEYARELASRFPDPLAVCFFVCSGTEANELALRMARTHTGNTGAVVVDGAYHGNSSSVINLSPYKFDGPGGKGRRPWVRVVPMPDTYRGLYRAGAGSDRTGGSEPAGEVDHAGESDHAAIGRRYAEHVREALASLNGDDGMYGSAKPLGAAAFFCESILSCGGQIPLPPGYLETAAAHVRDAGAVYVADEVQVGFGRAGSHFWAFEEHGVVPDIVTLGKPIGNGHPLAAVVTTREIAGSFANGMEYFNTYGGNPVSCAVGLEVLRIIDDEGLRERASSTGDRLLTGLRELVAAHEVPGDARGRGLFLGLELVSDRETREPAAAHASRLVERMRDRGVLLSTDGPDHNVIKIKPPLAFSETDADRVVEDLARTLAETWVAADTSDR